jgi:hypothetical protein
MLITADVIPSCGAALSTGPVTTDSRCKAAGLTVFTSADGTDLHLDHEPPLLEHERDNPSAVCDATRIQLLCRECHSAKTMREMRHA